MITKRADLNSFDIEIIQSGHVILDSSWHSENVCNFFTRIYYIKSGHGYLKVRGKVIDMLPGNIYIVPSECTFSYWCDSLDKIYFHLLIPAFKKYDLLTDVKDICSLRARDGLIDNLYELYYANSCNSIMKLRLIIYETLIEFSDTYKFLFQAPDKYSPLVTDAIYYIENHISLGTSVKQIAENLYVSESKLRNCFKEETGFTIGKYIDDIVFITVKKMLAADMSIEKISHTLGFCDRFYLSRRFKEKFGKTISDYRSELII